MSEVVAPLVFQLSVGGLVGAIVGYSLKKLSKLLIFLIGIFIIVVVYMSARGTIYGELWSVLSGFISWAGSAFSWLVGAISLLPFAASFIVGLLLGLKLA
jgi:uncharacterized membrane protein (Fun14 family)